MQISMRNYFELRLQRYNEGVNFLFTTEYNQKVASIIYQGEINDDGEIGWKPVVKNELHSLDTLEEKFNCKFYSSIYDYFNSYWFADLDGFIDGRYVSLEPVLPGMELKSFEKKLQGYKNNHKNKLGYVVIGIEGNGLVVVVNNHNGKVELEDFERGEFTVLSNNLDEFISSLEMKK
ncbi:Syd protein [Paenibacillus xylanivorans]|uniref:Syd protein n=2 Tax=Paenibacillus xylanivorans TaxID=1705561 RepID=A0A0M9BQ22_9BACL|nr:Syd protein [Paenibacillus xylanivorans]